TPKIFATTQSVTLSEGLNFCPGLRMENNCQNCGFSQVRMNGLGGPYSQILINSRPIFSGLAGVYGLELIPLSMIERVEVIRGGGSALYGSNAIAGTINLILKDPINNSYEFGVNTGLIGVGVDDTGDPAQDYSVNFNTSLVSADNKTGMALYGFYHDRKPFDANDDSFSEIASLKNTTIGTRLYHRFGIRSKLTADFFNIKEDRRGGDKQEYPVHETGITEAVKHNITTGALTYEKFFRDNDQFSVYASGQKVNRDSYYGAEQSLSDYGKTTDFSYIAGTQYNAALGTFNLIFGMENQRAWLKDNKLGYPDYDNAVIIDGSIVDIPHTDNVVIADQSTNTFGVFSQYEINWEKIKITAGARFDIYKVEDKGHNS
ncbi:MAG: TonB-dependent receptor plug domain-containing protein, partial [Bacteroidales bacterium]|nr:TonB-dependent receptor plug domain-containing protein [Bacteroidales bacterium]